MASTEPQAPTPDSEILKPLARLFMRNIQTAKNLGSLPLTLCIYGTRDRIGHALALKFLEKNTPEERAEITSRINEILKKGQPQLVEEAEEALRDIATNPAVQPAFRALVYAFLVSLWTAFESLAKDAWIAVLNKYPAEFARRAFEAQLSSQPGGDDTGGGSKVIPIRMIERYRFDLREAMGFLAATRFDFGNCRSMRLAYRVILKDEDLELFLNPDLNELESMRHVIVHRAGYVDAEFLKRNKAYPGAIGELLEIGGGVESLGKSVDASILAGIRLLALLDDRIRFL